MGTRSEPAAQVLRKQDVLEKQAQIVKVIMKGGGIRTKGKLVPTEKEMKNPVKRGKARRSLRTLQVQMMRILQALKMSLIGQKRRRKRKNARKVLPNQVPPQSLRTIRILVNYHWMNLSLKW